MKKILTPNNNMELDEALLTDTFFETANEETILQRHFASERVSYLDIEGYDIQQCLFTHCQVWHAKLRNTTFVDTTFEACDFSNSDFSKTIFHRCVFKDCKWIGVDAAATYMRNVLFESCLMNDSNWNASDLALTNFSQCRLQNASVSEAKWKLALDECDLTQAYLVGTSLQGIDLSTCELSGIVVDMKQMKGCIVNQWQAMELIRLMGVIVKD